MNSIEIFLFIYIYIYLPYVVPCIPVFYFNDLLHREIRKGQLRRHKNKSGKATAITLYA